MLLSLLRSQHWWRTLGLAVLSCEEREELCVAVCCSVLQCVTVCCSVLQRVAVCCSVLQYVAVSRSVLQCVAVGCSFGSVLQFLQCVVLCCIGAKRAVV